jgi:hypothetical protein
MTLFRVKSRHYSVMQMQTVASARQSPPGVRTERIRHVNDPRRSAFFRLKAAVERELNTHRSQSSAMKTLKTLTLSQFGEAGLCDCWATLILGASRRLAEHLRHRVLDSSPS